MRTRKVLGRFNSDRDFQLVSLKLSLIAAKEDLSSRIGEELADEVPLPGDEPKGVIAGLDPDDGGLELWVPPSLTMRSLLAADSLSLSFFLTTSRFLFRGEALGDVTGVAYPCAVLVVDCPAN